MDGIEIDIIRDNLAFKEMMKVARILLEKFYYQN